MTHNPHRNAGWTTALKHPDRKYTERGVAAMTSMEAWKARYIEKYGECEEPMLTRQAEILRTKELSERSRKGVEARRAKRDGRKAR